MTILTIEKHLNSLPQQITGNTIYFVKKNDKVECSLSNQNGSAVFAVTRELDEPCLLRVEDPVGPNLLGPTHVYIGQSVSFKITNFSSFRNYVITAVSGSVQLVDDVIIYTAPSTVQQSGIVINSRLINITLHKPDIQKPVVLSPTANQQLTGSLTTFISSAYDLVNTDISSSLYDWLSTIWEVSDTQTFTNVLFTSTTTVAPFNSWETSSLIENTVYYVRVRFNVQLIGLSEWSDPIMFTSTLGAISTVNQVKIQGTDTLVDHNFGQSVSVDNTGNTIVVGAPNITLNSNNSCGCIYVFTRVANNWVQEAQLLPSDTHADMFFGDEVKISADGLTIVASSSQSGLGAYASNGAVYVFRKNAGVWTEQSKITSVEETINPNTFGVSVAISSDGNKIVIGSPTATSINSSYPGKIYYYEYTGGLWQFIGAYECSDPVNGAMFGAKLAASSDLSKIVVSAPNASVAPVLDSGAVYVFELSGGGYNQTAVLNPTLITQYETIGNSLDISDDGTTIAVGNENYSGGSAGVGGATFIFKYTTSWLEEAVILGELVNGGNAKTLSLTADGSRLLIGEPYGYNTVNGLDSAGSVNVYTAAASVWTSEGKVYANDAVDFMSYGKVTTISGNGHVMATSTYTEPFVYVNF